MIVLVRHGETEANRERLALGRADPPLTARGEAQAAALAVALGGFAGTEGIRVVSSPLARARTTAAPIAAAVGVDVEVESRLVELDYGEWDVRSFAEFPPEDLARWRRDATFAPPGGESLVAVGARVGAWCAEVAGGPTVIAVSHVSPIKAAVLWAMDADPLLAWRMRLDVASITRIDASGAGGQRALVGFNETSHLR